MAIRKRFMAMTAAGGLAAIGAGVAPVTHVAASPSQNCNDGTGNEYKEITLSTNPTLAVEIGSYGAYQGDPAALEHPHVAICYATGPEGSTSPETAGGYVTLDELNGALGSVGAGAASDPNAAEQLNGGADLTPSYTLTPGPAGTVGDLITASIPFTICVGPCTGTGAGLNPTGLLVGQLVPTSEPGIGVGYSLQSLQVFVNGALVLNEPTLTVAGAYANPFGAVAESLNLSQGGPCFLNVCVPNGYVETTGTNVAGFQIAGIALNVPVPKECVYSNPNGACP